MLVQVIDDLGQVGEVFRVIGPVAFLEHAVNVRPLGVVGQAGRSIALDHLSQLLRGVVAPAAQVKAERPVLRERTAADHLGVLADHLGRCGARVDVEVEDAADGDERQRWSGLHVYVHAVAAQQVEAERVRVVLDAHVKRVSAV